MACRNFEDHWDRGLCFVRHQPRHIARDYPEHMDIASSCDDDGIYDSKSEVVQSADETEDVEHTASDDDVVNVLYMDAPLIQ